MLEGNLCLRFWSKQRRKKRKSVQSECETCLGLKLKQLQRRQRECSPQIVGCLNATYSHATASKKLSEPSESDVYFIPKHTLGLLGDVHEFVPMSERGG